MTDITAGLGLQIRARIDDIDAELTVLGEERQALERASVAIAQAQRLRRPLTPSPAAPARPKQTKRPTRAKSSSNGRARPVDPEEVYAWLVTAGGPVQAPAIGDAVGVNSPVAVRTALRKLEASGRIVRKGARSRTTYEAVLS